jgi:hypothetical protein
MMESTPACGNDVETPAKREKRVRCRRTKTLKHKHARSLPYNSMPLSMRRAEDASGSTTAFQFHHPTHPQDEFVDIGYALGILWDCMKADGYLERMAEPPKAARSHEDFQKTYAKKCCRLAFLLGCKCQQLRSIVVYEIS